MKYIKHTLFIIGAAMCFFIFSPSVSALTNTLTVGPTSVVLKAKPGEKKTFSVVLENSSKESILLKPSLGLFQGKAGDEYGAIDALKTTEGSPATWITFPKTSLQLSSGARTTVPVTVSIPKNIAGGGYNILINWQSRSFIEKKEAIHTRQIIQTTLIVDVSGPERSEKAEVITFSAGDSQILFDQRPVSFLLRVKNLGNVPIKPIGDIRIRNIFGQTVGILPLNQSKFDAGGYIPQHDGIRTYMVDWQKDFSFGRYTATLHASYGEKMNVLSATADIWILPIQLLIPAIFMLLFASVFTLYMLGKHLRSLVKLRQKV